ncbi:MAG TPA: arylamine N-acetyltransferase [Streptosporangiaceae bacterium]|nr:arylamine N-acetyltransferase [Streptosporangiaceae bacterium]
MTITQHHITPRSAVKWPAEPVDLDAYFARIGHTGGAAPTAETLRRLHRAHMSTICFENIDVALGRGVSLDVSSLQTKLVHQGRGGYCFEHNLLFAAALTSIGFPVTRLLARVRRGGTRIRYRAHAALLVEADETIWLADVGFGDEGLVEPIPFVAGAELTVGDWTWRLVEEAGEWVLQCRHADGWFDVYSFRLERHYPADFDVANYYTATNPRSTFVGRLVAQRGGDRECHSLLDNVLVTRHADGRSEQRELTAAETLETLRTTFKIAIPAADRALLRQWLSIKDDIPAFDELLLRQWPVIGNPYPPNLPADKAGPANEDR